MYNKHIDTKWQKKWEETELYKFNKANSEIKFYCMEMFSYPSGANLHLGHWYNFGLADIYARFKRLQGYNVFQPMGYDSFGLPAENYAIKTGTHPKISTEKSIRTMTQQLNEMGSMFNWENTLATHNENYYKWTQWLFIQLYRKGLAYRKKAPANWCPGCKTVLANEQVAGGVCERCKSEVYQKEMTQWFFKITAYADELIEGLKELDWPAATKKTQINWIGKSYGCEISFSVETINKTISIFTTRADTLMGVTYLVIAPEHPIITEIASAEYKSEIEDYIKNARFISEVSRLKTNREKTGVFTGAYAKHPITSQSLPIWISDYVLLSYGSGCVMAVPAHDTRDFDFATKYNLPIKQVIKGDSSKLPATEYGELINSGEFDGLSSKIAQKIIAQKLSVIHQGKKTTTYRLRDWLISRQRYWGAPIPIVYCDSCGIVPVEESSLPVRLPYDVEFNPNGVSPLKSCDNFLHTTCPKCGNPAIRETDTMDTFVCSSWYYLRYPDANNNEKPFDKEIISKMLPVDKYVGGSEHAAMHLLYARFITKALRDMGYINFDEPFLSLTHQGSILGSDGKRMSKSRPEFAVAPDKYTEKYGSDVLRLYLAFGFAYTEGGQWDENGFNGIVRFVNRIERIIEKYTENNYESVISTFDDELNFVRNNAIKGISHDLEKFHYNTCVARLMELTSALEKVLKNKMCSKELLKATIKDYIILLSPFAPHLSEELWEMLSYNYSIFNQHFPIYDEESALKNIIILPIQVNGKIRSKISIAKNADDSTIKNVIKNDEKILKCVYGKKIIKILIIKNKIANVIVK